jgi:glutaconate CoA-transferase subunit B
MDFGGSNHDIRVRSLHPGVTLAQVQSATGFPLQAPAQPPTTSAPSEAQLSLIRRLDPHGLRAQVIKGNPPGDGRARTP